MEKNWIGTLADICTPVFIVALCTVAQSGNHAGVMNSLMDKPDTYNELLVSYKKEQSSDICYNKDKYWKY